MRLRIVLAGVLPLLAAGRPSGATTVSIGAAGCAAYAEVQAQVSKAKALIAEGREGEVPDFDPEPALRTCFRQQVMPALVRAETNERLFDAAADGFTAWARQPTLLGILGRFGGEMAEGTASYRKGLTHAYDVARDRCVRLRDPRQLDEMLRLMRWAQLLGMEVSADPAADFAACLGGFVYLVQVHTTTASERFGVGADFRYTAVLGKAPRGEAGELVGRGSYGGFIIARNANCSPGRNSEPQRFGMGGELESSGAEFELPGEDMKPRRYMTYALTTTDWDLRPLYGGDGPFATTAEEREALAAAGSVFAARPIPLTGRLTTRDSAVEILRSTCDGATTLRTQVRIQRLSPAR